MSLALRLARLTRPILPALLLLLAPSGSPVRAATQVATTPGELAAAIQAANTNRADDIIELLPGVTYTLTAPASGANGLPPVLDDGGHSLTINGNGATLTRDSAEPFRILTASDGATLVLTGLTISGGDGPSARPGGAILAINAAVTLRGVTLADNDGDGIHLTAESGGTATASLANTTISSNGGTGVAVRTAGGGSTATATLHHVTIAGSGGPALLAEANGDIGSSASITLLNSIAGDGDTPACDTRDDGVIVAVTSLSDDPACAAFGATVTGNLRLGPLADNGGATATHALHSLSPALDAGSQAICTHQSLAGMDQRGRTRPADGDHDGAAACDIGAYEAHPAITFTKTGPDAVPPGGEIVYRIVISNDGDQLGPFTLIDALPRDVVLERMNLSVIATGPPLTSGPCVAGPIGVACSFTGLAADESVILTLTTRAREDLPLGHVITSAAEVQHLELTTNTVTTTLEPAPPPPPPAEVFKVFAAFAASQ